MSLKWVIIALAVLYVLSPIDLLPDFLNPLLGRLDDALVIVGLLLYYYFGINLLKWLVKGNRTSTSGGKDQQADQDQTHSAGGEEQGHPLDPYEILGVMPDASPEEIRKAYREVSQKYHPDKVSHLGPEFQELAEKKFILIQQAYETLRRRGQ